MKKHDPSGVKTLYIPYMSDHGLVVAAALEANGLPVVAMPPPDDESLTTGLDLCRGRECLPCFLIVGDVIRRLQGPGIEPARAALLLPTTGGLCRLGQYPVLLRALLEEHGLGDVEIVSPSAQNSYHGFGENSLALRRQIWQGAVAVDALQKLLHQSRPSEIEEGASDAAYQASLGEIVDAVRRGAGEPLVEAMQRTARRFADLALDRSERRPLIGLVGEIYVRLNPFSNQQVIRQIEAVGGEVTVATLCEWLYFTNWLYAQLNWSLGKYVTFATVWLSDRYQRLEERRVVEPVRALLRDPYETPTGELMRHLSPHYEPVLGLETEAGITIGKAVELARQRANGIVNVMPFNCMPGIVVAAMAPRFRSDVVDIPWLDISFDAQGATNIRTRLEAFLYQARQHQRRTRHAATTAGDRLAARS